VGNVFAFTPISLTVLVTVYTVLVHFTSGALTLHTIRVFPASFLLLVLFLVWAWFVHVRHLISPDKTYNFLLGTNRKAR
jgi:hypothetical protein